MNKTYKRQEFERIKNQLLADKQNLIERLNISNGKVKKYKRRIIDKNREINRLIKVLRDNSVDYTQPDVSSVDFATTSSTSSVHITAPEDTSNGKRTGMLKALGALATQVLNDDTEEASPSQTFMQSSVRTEDDNTTTEIEASTFYPQVLPANPPVAASSTSAATIATTTTATIGATTTAAATTATSFLLQPVHRRSNTT